MIIWYFAICMTLVMYEVKPPEKWWGYFTYLITWPTHLGIWLKENHSKGIVVNNINVNNE